MEEQMEWHTEILQKRLQRLYQQYLDQKFCDLIVTVHGEEFHVHACVLAAACSKLSSMLQKAKEVDTEYGRNEHFVCVRPAKRIILNMLTPRSFRWLLPYFYLGVLQWDELSAIDMEDIISAVKWCNFKEILDRCYEVKSTLDEEDSEHRLQLESPVMLPKPSSRDAQKCLTCYHCDMNFSYINAEAYMEHMNKHELEADSGADIILHEPVKKKYLKIATKRRVVKKELTSTVIVGTPSVEEMDEDILLDDSNDLSDIGPVVCEISHGTSTRGRKLKVRKPYRKRGTIRPSKEWHCPVCPDLVFNKKRDQVHHVRSVHGQIKPYGCEKCGKDFPSNSSLQVHMRVHTGEKPEICSECGNCFADAKTLKDHERRHTGEKPFLCTLCGKSFTFRQSLYRHMKFHEGKRPFECDICGMAFVLRHNLKEHHARHDKQQKIKCARCSLVMGSKEAAAEHRKHCAGVQNLPESEDITEITLEPIEPEISDDEECESQETIVNVDVMES